MVCQFCLNGMRKRCCIEGFHFVSIAKAFSQINFRGEQSGGLRCCDRIGRFPLQTPFGARPGLVMESRCEAPGDIRIETE